MTEWYKTIRAAIYAAFEMKSRGTIMYFADIKEEITWDEVIANLIESLPPEMQEEYKTKREKE